MSIGSKIKSLRKKRGMTQATLADGIITRGMLSRIESGSACPSMQSLNAIASRLEISPSFLIEDGDDISSAEYARIAKTIEEEFKLKNYQNCLQLLSLYNFENDAKFAPVYIVCAMESACSFFFSGNFKNAKEILERINEIYKSLILTPSHFSEKQVSLMLSIINNIDNIDRAIDLADIKPDFNSPLCVFFCLLKLIKDGNHSECCSLMKFCETDTLYSKYIDAQLLIKDYKFIDAMILMKNLLADSNSPIFLKLLCLRSLENCCKLCEDYKGAYENHLSIQELLLTIKR